MTEEAHAKPTFFIQGIEQSIPKFPDRLLNEGDLNNLPLNSLNSSLNVTDATECLQPIYPYLLTLTGYELLMMHI